MTKTEIISIKCGLAKVFIIKAEKTIIVDSGLKGSTDKILDILNANNIPKEDVSLLLITHAHPDHCLNTKHLKETLKIPVAISSGEAKYLAQGDFSPVIPLGTKGKIIYKLLESIHNKHDDKVEADIVFTNELDLTPYGVNGKAIITPGHTYGGISIILDNGHCIAGDLILETSFLKNPMFPLFAVDIELLKSSIKNLLTYDIDYFYSSHGKRWSKAEVKNKLLKKL